MYMKIFPLLLLFLAMACSRSNHSSDAQWEKLSQQREAEREREKKAQAFDSQVRLIRLRHGEAVASKYRMCHTSQPTTSQDQLECKQLDERLASYIAKYTR
jgi:hypothetical protein